jgi:uncharacterized protein (TIGR03435 family)
MFVKLGAGLVFVAALASGQTRPAFEVASIKPIRDFSPIATMYGDISHGRFTLTNAHLKQMIAIAYGIQTVRIEGGPSWINGEQYQINAKAENPETTDEQVKAMLGTLLEDRFQLRMHRENKLLPNYTLRVGPGGAKVPKAQESGSDRCNRTQEGTKYELACEHIEIQTLANALAVMLRSPVVDETGLTGSYDFTLSWEGDDMYAGVPDAVERFGLKLEMKKVPTEVWVIDSVEKPSEN